MTDKVQKIREEVEMLFNHVKDSNFESDSGAFYYLKDLLDFIDSLQEEPVSEFLNTESMIESYKQRLISQANGMKNSPLIDMCLASYKHGINETIDTINLSNVQRTTKNWKEPVSEDLETEINYLSKRYPEVSFAKLSRIAVHVVNWQKQQTLENKILALGDDLRKVSLEWDKKVNFQLFNMVMNENQPIGIEQSTTSHAESFIAGANWQKKQDQETIELAEDHAMLAGMNKMEQQMMANIWKPADGDDLPEYEREVVVFTQNFPDDAGIMSVAIAHRPTPEGYDGKSLTTGEVEHYTPMTYDKGGWNIPDVKWWLDCSLPNMEED